MFLCTLMILEHIVYVDRCNRESTCCPTDRKPILTSSSTKIIIKKKRLQIKAAEVNRTQFYQKHSSQHMELDQNRLGICNFPYKEINLLLGSQRRSQNREIKWAMPVAVEVVFGKWNCQLFFLARTLCYLATIVLLSRCKPQPTKWIHMRELIHLGKW